LRDAAVNTSIMSAQRGKDKALFHEKPKLS
jgi:hypothetical protein